MIVNSLPLWFLSRLKGRLGGRHNWDERAAIDALIAAVPSALPLFRNSPWGREWGDAWERLVVDIPPGMPSSSHAPGWHREAAQAVADRLGCHAEVTGDRVTFHETAPSPVVEPPVAPVKDSPKLKRKTKAA